jgi:nicotinate-nucleotide adenylyltransferase
MEFFRRAPGAPGKLGILAGAFNPPTRAHLALARAALGWVDEVVFVLPRVFPHKAYEGAGFAERVHMLEAALQDEPRYSIAASERGLFLEIARECRAEYGPGPELYFVCGRDAAERFLEWDYGAGAPVGEQLREFQLLVADRAGRFQAPPELGDRIHPLAMEADWISATAVRERMRSGQPWEELVPEAIVELARRAYCSFCAASRNARSR